MTRTRNALPDHYAALGLTPTCTAREVKTAWKATAKQWHPDKVEGAAQGEGLTDEQIAHRVAGAGIRFREARTAYEVLRSAAERADYDAARVREAQQDREAAREWERAVARSREREGREREAARGEATRGEAAQRWAADQRRWEDELRRADQRRADQRRADRDRHRPDDRRWPDDPWRRAAVRATCDYIAVVTAAWGPVDPWTSGPWARSDILLPLD